MRWALGVLAFALGLGAGLWGLEGGLAPKPLSLGGCRPGPLPERADLYANGVVEIPLCREAEVVLRLEGTPAKGEGPWAVVAEGDRVLWQGEVLGLKEVRVRTTGRGVLVLAFLNDLYAPPEDRNLFLRGLRVR
ncbi:hypothetical protein [Thermus thermophilus]|uniref:hypothetical protein n=1 Tax=Thermus thermophilus TaxID=274 RepID=UPI001FCB7650|nr:hypothetical protein [Thermus thermophilus]BDG21488.1 hypothetical protein TthSNM17_11500 [Thermus thermophilus]